MQAEFSRTDLMALLNRLKSSIEGDILDDKITRAMFSSGACLYHIEPLAVVQPRTKADVREVVAFAARHGMPLTARGAGTSRTGNELGRGLILDFSKALNRVMEVNSEKRWIRIQPGITLSSLNRHLRSEGLFFPIDPSTQEVCTLGGMVANNSSGPHAVKYGTTRDHVLSLEVALSNGEMIKTRRVHLLSDEMRSMIRSDHLEGAIYRALPGILNRYAEPLKRERPFTMKNSSGYHMWELLSDDTLDLTPLFVGSEGTLGIVTEVKLALTPHSGRTRSALVYFDDLEHIGRATQLILEKSPAMIEIVERQILDLAREEKPELRSYLPEGTEGLLYVEFHEEDEESCRAKFREIAKRIAQQKLATDLRMAENNSEMAVFAQVRSISGPILNRVKGPRKPLAFIEDTAVHPTRLTEYIAGLRKLFKRFDVEASIYGHAGDGNLHVMVFMDPGRFDEVRKMTSLTEACYDWVLSLNGTISAEHGDGRLRSHYLRKQYPELFSAMMEVKRLFDPDDILNPGCIVNFETNPLFQDLKFGPGSLQVPTGSVFHEDRHRGAIETCSGCGKCRSYCPVARQINEEWALGRGKVTILRQVILGHLDPEILHTAELKRIMDSCINCKRCLQECPSGADVPWLAIAGRQHFLLRHGESISNRFLTDTQRLSRLGSAVAPFVDRINTCAPLRHAMEKTVGLDRRRLLPRFHRGRKRESVLRERPTTGKRVVYFQSCYERFNRPAGKASDTVLVLQYNGFHALTPDFPCCGIAQISSGAKRRVMKNARNIVRKMASYVDQGLDIVFDEPSCALAVKMEYPKLLNTPDSIQVAENCYDIQRYLFGLHQKSQLRQGFQRIDRTVALHNPCHLRALGIQGEPVELLALIPGLEVRVLEDDCCGLAGIYGMKKEHFDLSMRIGSRLFHEINAAGAEIIASSCRACRLQIQQGTGREAVHPIALLALAYGGAAQINLSQFELETV